VIYIVLPVHNRREITRGFVECLARQTSRDYRLVLVDDGSTDGTAEVVRSIIPSAVVLRGDGKLWWAGALQQALDWLRGAGLRDDDLVLVINDDVRFDADYLERAARIMASKPRTLVLSRFRGDAGEAIETGVSADLRLLTFEIAESPDRINCLSTRGLFANWATIREIGPLHPHLLPHYLSDYEFTIRAHRKGFRCETSGELLVVPNHETTGIRAVSTGAGTPLGSLFSKRSTGNPIYWTSFVMLAVPARWKLAAIARVWRRAARTMLATLRAT
jgi:GT2 family glycosyltransferase